MSAPVLPEGGDDGTFIALNPDCTGAIPRPRAAQQDVPSPPSCQRCYRLAHYGAVEPAAVNEAALLQAMAKAGPGVVVYVVDIFDLPGSLFRVVRQACSPVKGLLLVVNKVDLLGINMKVGASPAIDRMEVPAQLHIFYDILDIRAEQVRF